MSARSSLGDPRAGPDVQAAEVRVPRRVGWRPLSGARTRILAAFALLTAVSAALSLFLVREVLFNRLEEQVEQHLTQEVAEFRRLVRGNDPRTGEPFGANARRIFDVFFSRNVPDEGEVILSSIDHRLYRSARAGDAEFRPGEVLRAVALERSLDEEHRGTVETSTGPARYVNVPVESGGRVLATFTVANFPANERDEIESAVMVAAQVFAAVFLLSFFAAWGTAGRVLAPFRLLRDTAQSITETDLTRRISVRGHDEVAQIARTFNDMLDRLEPAFTGQRRFVNDASHELQTPLTIVRGHLELLADDPEERRETLALVMDELDRMSRIVNDLLVLAKAEQPDFLRPEVVDVEALTGELHEKVVALAPRGWRIDSVGCGSILADRERLTQAIVELASNAAKQTEAGETVALGSFVGDGEARIWVRDTGAGIPREEQTRIFRRFSRGSGPRSSEGAGLGLSIVDAIARAHGGRVELSSRPGFGATFTVVVPAPTRLTHP
jgi:signal transduction histidine kinase